MKTTTPIDPRCLVAFLVYALPAMTSAQVPGCHAGFTFDTNGLTATFNDTSWFDVGPQQTIWSWSFGDGDTGHTPSPTHAYPQSGTYIICLTVTNCGTHPGTCCTDTYCDTITIGQPGPTDIGDVAVETGPLDNHRDAVTAAASPPSPDMEIVAFPNPCSEGLTVSLSIATGRVTIHLIDALGHAVRSYLLLGHELVIPTAGLESGVYHILAFDRENVISEAIAILH